jgi:cell division protease FtsH
MAELKMLGGTTVMQAAADVAASRERARRARVRKLIMVGALVVLWWCGRALAGNPVHIGPPHISSGLVPFLPGFALIALMCVAFLGPMLGMGRSPHVLYRPSEIDISLEDVKGAEVVVDEVVKTLNLFLSHKTFKERMGGTPRRAILFEGPPGTGKTYMAKAMAREAGVPFLFVSSSAFQSMYYGQTNRKIRSYFKALRAYARREGGAICASPSPTSRTSSSSAPPTGPPTSTPRCCGRAGSTARSTSASRAAPAGARSSTTTSTRRHTSPSSTTTTVARAWPRRRRATHR